MNTHNDPALKGYWKTDSKGNYLQWVPAPTDPEPKRKEFLRRVGLELVAYLVIVAAGATLVCTALQWLTNKPI